MLCRKDRCVGCGACADVCPVGAIRMTPDEKGFCYPVCNGRTCINCGACDRVCPVKNKPETARQTPRVLAAYAEDADMRRESTSGGTFTLLAEKIIEKGGVVFGAVFREDFSVCHMGAADAEGLAAMRGSKYMQSDLADTYKQCKKALAQKKPVLFTGTPCQIAGLYAFLGGDSEQLYTCDIVCHGAPSPAFWQTYLRELEKRYGAKVTKVAFRSKKTGWHCASLEVTFENGKTRRRWKDADPFMRAFLRNYVLRDSCYDCAFVGSERTGDITLGDFWGYKAGADFQDDDRGISLVLLNSEKGERLFGEIGQKAVCCEKTLNAAAAGNATLIHGFKKPEKYDDFWTELTEKGFSAAEKKYMTPEKDALKKRLLWTGVGRKIQRIIKK